MRSIPNITMLIIKKLCHAVSDDSDAKKASLISRYARTLYEITSLNPEFANQKQGEIV